MMNRPEEHDEERDAEGRTVTDERPPADEEIGQPEEDSTRRPAMHEAPYETPDEARDEARDEAPPPAADEQLTVPEDREAAAEADRRTDSPPGPVSGYEVITDGDRDDFRRRWEALQASFVDDPKGAAEKADALVGELIGQVGQRHQELRDELGDRSDRDADTEAMRIALQRYRAFYRLLVRT